MSYVSKLPLDTKLLVTAITRFELDAASEIWHILRRTSICDNAEIIFIKKNKKLLKGIFGVAFQNDPILAVERMREYLSERPWIMRFSQRIVPIEFISSELEAVLNFIEKEGSSRISSNETWKIQINKHESKVNRAKLIEVIANRINLGKVNLSNPDWIINIEIVLDTYAVSIIHPKHIIRKKELKDKLKI